LLNSNNNTERRIAARFPIERDIRYKLLLDRDGAEGAGKSINISSGGILFTTDRPLRPGTGIEVAISWPVLMDAEISLELVARGQVVRSANGETAVKIYRHEFRTSQVDALARAV